LDPAAVLLLPVVLEIRVPVPIAVLSPAPLATELHPGAAHVGLSACAKLELSVRTTAKAQ
jgi:hypothetical protein